jgi:two-component system CheB/CheR fusion protein
MPHDQRVEKSSRISMCSRLTSVWASDSTGSGQAKTALRVLVVENHLDTRTYLSLCLSDCGYEVQSAEGMQDALEFLKKEKFDILLSDVSLNDGDGWRLLELAGPSRPPYAIAMSGFGAQKDQQKSLAVGYRHHLVKPFTAAELRDLLKRVETPPTKASSSDSSM